MFLKRNIAKTIRRFAKFPVIAVIGPRQSGKTTLVKNIFKKHTYLTLENPSIRDMAISDPERFLRQHDNTNGIIIDEFQHAPALLSYIQIIVDEKNAQDTLC